MYFLIISSQSYIRLSITALRRAKLEPDGVESIRLDVKSCGNSWFQYVGAIAHPANARFQTSYPRLF